MDDLMTVYFDLVSGLRRSLATDRDIGQNKQWNVKSLSLAQKQCKILKEYS